MTLTGGLVFFKFTTKTRLIGEHSVNIRGRHNIEDVHMSTLKTRFLLLLSLLTGIPALSIAQSTRGAAKLLRALRAARTFEDIFVSTRTVNLKIDALIGEITHLDLGETGQLLIVDRLTHKTLLFDRTGNLEKEINVEFEVPGLKWQPERAWFGQNGTILIQVSSTNKLFLFDSHGSLIKAIETFFPGQYRDMVVSEAGFIYGYATYATPEGVFLSVKRLNFEGDVLATGGVFPRGYENFLSRNSLGGLTIDKHGNLYQFNACGPEIYKLEPHLRLIKTFKEKPLYYKQLKSDYPDFQGDPQAFMKKASALVSKATLTFDVDTLGDSLLLIQYIELGSQGGTYLSFCDLEGHFYTKQKISSFGPIKAIHGYLVYKTEQPEPDKSGNLPNPIVQEYQFKYE